MIYMYRTKNYNQQSLHNRGDMNLKINHNKIEYTI